MPPIFMISICPSVQALATVSQVARISPAAVLPPRTIGLAACKIRVGNRQLFNIDSCCFPLNAQKCVARITGKPLRRKEQILADNTKERTQAEAQFKKTQKQKEGAEAMAAYVVDAHAVRAKTARLRELRLAKEAADKAVKEKPVEKAKKRST
jgi:hypothetical protein